MLRESERRPGIVSRLASAFQDQRDPTLIDHELTVLLKTRIFAIACGYKDAMIWTTCVTIRFNARRWPPSRERRDTLLAIDDEPS